jgi:hypothetical protein
MSKNMFAAKLAAGTRKAKKINTKSTKSSASTSKVENIVSKAIPKSTSLTELAYQQDLLNPVDLELFWKKTYLVRIWPD